MEILKSVNCDKRDFVKAGVAVDTVQEHSGEILKVTGMIIATKYSEDEQKDVEVTAIKVADDAGDFFITSISKTVKESAETIISAFDESDFKGGLEIVIKSKKSKANRDFYYLDLK